MGATGNWAKVSCGLKNGLLVGRTVVELIVVVVLETVVSVNAGAGRKRGLELGADSTRWSTESARVVGCCTVVGAAF